MGFFVNECEGFSGGGGVGTVGCGGGGGCVGTVGCGGGGGGGGRLYEWVEMQKYMFVLMSAFGYF